MARLIGEQDRLIDEALTGRPLATESPASPLGWGRGVRPLGLASRPHLHPHAQIDGITWPGSSSARLSAHFPAPVEDGFLDTPGVL